MEDRSRTMLEAALAIGILLLIGAGTILAIGASVPQKPAPTIPPTNTPSPVRSPAITRTSLPQPSPSPSNTPRPVSQLPTPAPTPTALLFTDLERAQQYVPFELLQPASLPAGSSIQRIEIHDHVMFQSISIHSILRVSIYYKLGNGGQLEYLQTEPSSNTFFMRVYLEDAQQQNILQILGEKGRYETDTLGQVHLFWSRNSQVFALRDDGGKISRDDLLKVAESIPTQSPAPRRTR